MGFPTLAPAGVAVVLFRFVDHLKVFGRKALGEQGLDLCAHGHASFMRQAIGARQDLAETGADPLFMQTASTEGPPGLRRFGAFAMD
ncbi:hypothetical protein GCM10007285_28800 [Stappia taiwanensis]|nr:hypothetical protein GCM10007285_28800 [Stappia taiwanensis]